MKYQFFTLLILMVGTSFLFANGVTIAGPTCGKEFKSTLPVESAKEEPTDTIITVAQAIEIGQALENYTQTENMYTIVGYVSALAGQATDFKQYQNQTILEKMQEEVQETIPANQISGSCGDNLTWTINLEDSTLTITGNGDMTVGHLTNADGVMISDGPHWGRYIEYMAYVSLPEGLTSIADFSFGCVLGGGVEVCPNLTSIVIPSSVTQIGRGAFSNTILGGDYYPVTSSLSSITCKAITPPILGEDVFVDVDTMNCILYVPTESVGTYQAAEQWKAFANILPIESTQENSIVRIGDLSYILDDGEAVVTKGDHYNTLSDVVIPEYVEYEGQIYFVEAIGDSAFMGLNNITSLTINTHENRSAVKIGSLAFAGCSNLQTLKLRNVHTIDSAAFSGNTSLTSVILPNVSKIGPYAFSGCTNLKIIDLPIYQISFGSHAFASCNKLRTVFNHARSPLAINSDVFANIDLSQCTLLVRSSSLEDYSNADTWNDFGTIQSMENYCGIYLTWEVNNGELVISGIGEMWNYQPDLSYSTTSNATPWGNQITSISLPEGLTSIGDYAFQKCSYVTSVIIPNSVTTIGNGAFWQCTGGYSSVDPGATGAGLSTVTIGSGVTYIGIGAFSECSLDSLICLAVVPPTVAQSKIMDTFTNEYETPLFVPAGSEGLYNSAPIWQIFNPILPISQAIEVDNSAIQAEPEANSVVLEWIADSEASTYTIEIKQDQTTVCSLVFDAQGHLESNTYDVLARSISSKIQQKATQTSTGWQYTIGGLEVNTDYTYTVVARRNDNSEVYNTTIQFRTQATTTDFDQIINERSNSIKLLRNGQILILRGDRTYTLTGQEVK